MSVRAAAPGRYRWLLLTLASLILVLSLYIGGESTNHELIRSREPNPTSDSTHPQVSPATKLRTDKNSSTDGRADQSKIAIWRFIESAARVRPPDRVHDPWKTTQSISESNNDGILYPPLHMFLRIVEQRLYICRMKSPDQADYPDSFLLTIDGSSRTFTILNVDGSQLQPTIAACLDTFPARRAPPHFDSHYYERNSDNEFVVYPQWGL